MDFQHRLEKAIQRGIRAAGAEAEAEAQRAMNVEELRRLHTQYRLELSEHIEACVGQLPEHFPGFRLERIIGDRGWGAAVSRDDIHIESGRRQNLFSRLELAIRPLTDYYALELVAKGTIRNKEVFNRAYFQRLTEAVPEDFRERVDLWVLEYAELYARGR